MSGMALIPWAQTDWQAAGRFAGKSPLPLNETGMQQVSAWAQELAAKRLRTVYHAMDTTARHVADILASQTGARRKQLADLAELDLGLWEGLTKQELKKRFPKVFKAWLKDAQNVCPPCGEGLSEAAERLDRVLAKIARRQKRGKNRVVAVVLGPLAMGIVRCRIEQAPLRGFRNMMRELPAQYDADVIALLAQRGKDVGRQPATV